MTHPRRQPLRPVEAAALGGAVLALGPFAFTPPALAIALGGAWAAFLED